jgi:hypothetical protein
MKQTVFNCARFLLALLLCTTLPVQAHHSTAIYDSDNPIELTGKVTAWKFTNPHCLIELEVVAANGETQMWTLEGSNTSLMFRRGWTPETLKPDQEIMVTVRPLRSGAHGGNYSNVRDLQGNAINPRDDGREY